MNRRNNWKRNCCKTQQNFLQVNLTFFPTLWARSKPVGDIEKISPPLGVPASLRQSQSTTYNHTPTLSPTFQPWYSLSLSPILIRVGVSLLVVSGGITKASAQFPVQNPSLNPDFSVLKTESSNPDLAPQKLAGELEALQSITDTRHSWDALKMAQSLPVLTPTQPAAVEQLNQGIALIQQGKVPEAIAAFRQASQLNPQLAPAHYNLGLALRQSGQLQEAADAFYQATQADSDFALAFANLGAALLEGNNLQQAQDYLTRALELDPNLGVAHYNYGLVLSQMGKPDEAMTHFKNAMQFSPNAPEPIYHIGLIYLQQGKTAEAKKAFGQALKINPQYPEAHYNMGSILFKEGNLDSALESFRKAAESNSNYANAYYGAGLVFLRQNRLSDAKQVLQYAQVLYSTQGNPQWASQAQQLLEQLP